MSVQTGICYFDGRQVDHFELAFLLKKLEERGPDSLAISLSKSVGMGFRGFFIAPEEKANQPLMWRGNSLITFDGRLDNREGLACHLGIQASTTLSDVELVRSAYERFEEHCFALMSGEYACVLWDERRQRLFLVRSLCGTRPLFYVVNKERILWSSEIDDLVVKSNVDTTVNEVFAVGYLYYQPDVSESPFQNVGVVPCGTYIAISGSGRVEPAVPIWHPERIATLELRSDADYEEAWREQVARAIADRLRVKHRIVCELSGGLDSSTLTLMSDEVLRKAGRDPALLTTLSYTFELSHSCDETFFINLVEGARERAGLRVHESELDGTLGLEDIEFTGVPNANHCFPGRFRRVRELMRSLGARVLMTGIGGDELFCSNHTGTPELADLIVSGRWLTALAEARKWSEAGNVHLYRLLLTDAIGPITVASRLFQWHPVDKSPYAHWMTPETRKLYNRPGRIVGLPVATGVSLPSRRIRVHSVRAAAATIAAGYFREYHGIYPSHPFAHQRLIDFILSLPMNQLARPGEERSLMRRATSGLLPERIRTRKSKGTSDAAFCRMFGRECHAIGDPASLEVCQKGYAEPRAVAEAVQQTRLGRVRQTTGLNRLLSLERWLRSLKLIERRRLLIKSLDVGESLAHVS